MRVHLTERALVADVPAARRALDAAGVPERMPFVLEDDGRYPTILNRFLRSLPNRGCQSPATWLAYARDLVTYAGFCRRLGTEPEHAGRGTLDAYRTWRLTNPDLELRVEPSSWNRSVSAITKFYSFCVEEGLAESAPIPIGYTSARFGPNPAGRRNYAMAKHARRGDIRFLSIADYRTWVDVGVRGQLPDGRPDPSFRGRNTGRDEAFVELLARSGLRIDEASSLLVCELPVVTARPMRWYPLRIAGANAKGAKGRTVELRSAVLAKIHHYLDDGRSAALSRAAARRRLRQGQVVTGATTTGVTFPSGRTVGYGLLDAAERRQLRDGQGQPLALWLTERGDPATPSTWREMLERANDRCARLKAGVPAVHPHMLRHTYAVHTLNRLIKEQLVAIAPGRTGGPDTIRNPYAHTENALRRLARLLGHSSVTTTYEYLHCLNDAQALIDAAFESWAEDGAPAAELDRPGPLDVL